MLPKVIDLFSGCGGLALGFDKAGFDITGGAELMPAAHQTITINLCWRYGKEEETHVCGDITQMGPEIFSRRMGEEGCIVIGGPPCQAYSLAGRAKLRSLGEDRKNTNDSRGYLYQDFLRLALGLDAKVVVMENVPESTNYGGKNIPETVSQILADNGYHACWTVLNSADYGVPQVRERVFVLASKENEIELPTPVFRNPEETFTNYERQFERFSECSHFRFPNRPGADLPAWATVGDAFSDLPVLFTNEHQKYKLVPLNDAMPYRTPVQNSFQKIMRTWFGEETSYLTANSFRKTLRDFPVFSRMKQGDNYVQASRIAEQILREEADIYGYAEGTEDYEKLKKRIVPPYSRDKFTEKWKRLCLNRPSHTVVAHLSVDTYSHIHPTEPRGISVREAARLQSFPDDFYFNCAMGDAYRQIGNAVPPLLSLAIAEQVRHSFDQE